MNRRKIKHISFYSTLIQTIGYDPQSAIMEVRLLSDGKIRRYENVPEYIWYRLREDYHPDTYYRRNVCGRFVETIISDDEEEM